MLARCDLRYKRSGPQLRYIEGVIRKSIKKQKQKTQSPSNSLTAKHEQTFSPKETPLNSHLVASHSCFGEPAGHHRKDLCRQSSNGFRMPMGPWLQSCRQQALIYLW